MLAWRPTNKLGRATLKETKKNVFQVKTQVKPEQPLDFTYFSQLIHSIGKDNLSWLSFDTSVHTCGIAPAYNGILWGKATHSSIVAWGIPWGRKKSDTTERLWFSLFLWGFPGGTSDKEPACHAGDIRGAGFHPQFGRSPGGEQGNPLQCSRLENPVDKGAWGLQSMGSHRVWLDWSNLARTRNSILGNSREHRRGKNSM